MKSLVCFLALIVPLVICGCGPRYVEQETLAGSVPPPPEGRPVPVPDMESAPVMTPETEDDDKLADVIHFKDRYAANGAPRIVILFNRELSDEVREWRTPERVVVSGDGKIAEETVEEGTRKTTKTLYPFSAYGQTHIDTQGRVMPPEDWTWQFQESFLGEFLKAKVNMIDLTTILRTTAAETGKQGEAHDLLAVKSVEMDALLEKADLLMELLVRRNGTSPIGHEFRVSVKQVKTGKILANVTSLSWKQS